MNIDLILAEDITMPYKATLVGVDPDDISRLYEIENSSLKFYLACSFSTHDKVITAHRNSMKTIMHSGFYQKTLFKWQKNAINNQYQTS